MMMLVAMLGGDDDEAVKNGVILEEAWVHFSGHRIGVLD